jgi:hypothetical protein
MSRSPAEETDEYHGTHLHRATGALPALASRGYDVSEDLGGRSVTEARRFLDVWVRRMRPLYLAVSLPDDFNFPADADPVRARVLEEIILPTCREHGLPLALMVGVRRGVNPRLRSAGDGLGRADVSAVERLCAAHTDVRFLVTFLSRENQHELCVSARKFSNLMPFGCWWFLNNPSIISEVTRERLELLGTSSRRIIADALYEAYESLVKDGRPVMRHEVERDVTRLFSGNFSRWVGLVFHRTEFDDWSLNQVWSRHPFIQGVTSHAREKVSRRTLGCGAR